MNEPTVILDRPVYIEYSAAGDITYVGNVAMDYRDDAPDRMFNEAVEAFPNKAEDMVDPLPDTTRVVIAWSDWTVTFERAAPWTKVGG